MHARPCSLFRESCRLVPRRQTAFPRAFCGGGRKARRSNGRFRLNVSEGLWAREEGGWRFLHHLRLCLLCLCGRRGRGTARRVGHETVRRTTGRGRRHVWPFAELGGRGPWQIVPEHPLLGPPQVSVRGVEGGSSGPDAGTGTQSSVRGTLKVAAEGAPGEGCAVATSEGSGVRAPGFQPWPRRSWPGDLGQVA
jgi:hypothetical protein